MRGWIAASLTALCAASCGGAFADGDHWVDGGVEATGGTSGNDEPRRADDMSFSFENPAASCLANGPSEPRCSVAQGVEHLVGRWYQCSGSWFGMTGPMPDANGVQFEKDGTWRALSIVGKNVSYAEGPRTSGKWENHDAQLSGDQCTLGVSIHVDDAGMAPAYAEYLSSPRRMRLNTGGDGARPLFAAMP